MSRKPGRGIVAAILIASCVAAGSNAAPQAAPAAALPARAAPGNKSLTPFASERELRSYFEQLKKELAPPAPKQGAALEEVAVTGTKVESITNNQTEGVDEGGIVKVHGNHLVILRRGRLFTVAIGDRQLRPISWINAFGPGIDGSEGWIDEMLIHGERIVVIGYSYRRSGTEIGLFNIDSRGRLSYDGTYQLRSDDYYSSRNYASRLIGDKLVFYAPLDLNGDLEDLPGLRKWPEFMPSESDEEAVKKFKRIASATRIYRPVHRIRRQDYPTLHTVTTCDLARAELACDSVVAVGPGSSVFYVSATAAYVWIGNWTDRHSDPARGMVYRLPLDGSTPTALSVVGMPVDQFSFMESADGHLNVLVRAQADGDRMWSAEQVAGNAALLRVPLAQFGDGRQPLTWSDYRSLPAPDDEDATFHNRFVGDHLLYGMGDGWDLPEGASATLNVVDIETLRTSQLPLPHSIDRIEPMGTDAVVVGSDDESSLFFTGVKLAGTPRLRQRHVIANAAQGELRSHGFFYLKGADGTGTLGLPIRGGGERGASHLSTDSASIVFLRNADGAFSELGRLQAGAEEIDDDDDNCAASCIDWYGNARPIFLRGRTFALLGYELVEGRVIDGRLRERARVNFMPAVSE